MFYFLLKPYIGPKQANYQHACIVFAEGLTQLKKNFEANIDYFPDTSGKFLFSKGTITKETQYIVTAHPEDFKDDIVRLTTENKHIIIFDSKDEWVRPQSINFLKYAYRYFMTSSLITSNRIKPLCFAISNRMIETIAEQPKIPWAKRSEEIFWAHRVTNHYLRNIVKGFYDTKHILYHTHLDNFVAPDDSIHYWNHTGRRHTPGYFAELQKYKYMDAHGGYDTHNGGIVQWDSWKVWEGFLSGMLVITADLDFYNIKLPYPLKPYVHYIPVRYSHIQDSYSKLDLIPDKKKEEIALNGQKYVLENYCPKSMAKFILNEMVPSTV